MVLQMGSSNGRAILQQQRRHDRDDEARSSRRHTDRLVDEVVEDRHARNEHARDAEQSDGPVLQGRHYPVDEEESNWTTHDVNLAGNPCTFHVHTQLIQTREQHLRATHSRHLASACHRNHLV